MYNITCNLFAFWISNTLAKKKKKRERKKKGKKKETEFSITNKK